MNHFTKSANSNFYVLPIIQHLALEKEGYTQIWDLEDTSKIEYHRNSYSTLRSSIKVRKSKISLVKK
jgi:hypothetical protein